MGPDPPKKGQEKTRKHPPRKKTEAQVRKGRPKIPGPVRAPPLWQGDIWRAFAGELVRFALYKGDQIARQWTFSFNLSQFRRPTIASGMIPTRSRDRGRSIAAIWCGGFEIEKKSLCHHRR